MTTIVATLEGVAADMRVSTSGSYYPARKVFRVGDSILGTAGNGFMCLAFLDWFRSPKRNPKDLHELIGKETPRDEIEILEVNHSGIFIWDGWGYGEQVLRDSHAVGTGGMAALEAIRRGASLEEAVTSAFGHDEYSGCEVQVEYLLPPELVPKRKRRGS